MEIVITIPAYQPDEKFLTLLEGLREKGFEKIIVLDDGSDERCRESI